jgi:hypothetical protein
MRASSYKLLWLTICRVQIQILLYMLKLSLPGAFTIPSVKKLPSSRASKRRLLQPSSSEEDNSPQAILEDRLESLMDRLMLWQMSMPDVEETNEKDGVGKPIRDWTQIFCDEIIQPQYVI